MQKNRILKWIAAVLLLGKLADLFARVVPGRLMPARVKEEVQGLPFVAAFLTWWRGQSKFRRHLMTNLVIGLAIAVMLMLLHGKPWLQEIEDAGIDWVMHMQRGTAVEEAAMPFVILDIDERTYQAWGEPFHMPRDRLARLIDYAVRGGAELVVVDVDLSQRGHDPKADARLRSYLAEAGSQPEGPPIILARTFRAPLDAAGGAFRIVRRSFLEEDARIANAARIHWGSTLFELDRDRLLRRWRLWEIACADGQPTTVPSIQLLSAALLRQPDTPSQKVVGNVRAALDTLAPPGCHAPAIEQSHGHGVSGTIHIGDMALSNHPSAVAQRILYTLPWQLRPGERYPTVTLQDGTQAPMLTRRSAWAITDGDKPLSADWLAGRVVVIGASFEESRDLHFTPLGRMPGTLVLANAMHSLYQHGELTPPPWYVKLLIEAALIVIMSIAFAVFNSFWGMVVSGLVIIVLLVPVTFYVFKFGVWLDFAIPLVAVQLHQLAAEFEEARAGSRGH